MAMKVRIMFTFGEGETDKKRAWGRPPESRERDMRNSAFIPLRFVRFAVCLLHLTKAEGEDKGPQVSKPPGSFWFAPCL